MPLISKFKIKEVFPKLRLSNSLAIKVAEMPQQRKV